MSFRFVWLRLRLIHHLVALAAVILAAGCSPVGTAIGAAATVTNMALEERGFVASVDDKLIWLSINNRLANLDKKLFEQVSLQVHEGRVVLTGFVPMEQDRISVTRNAWASEGVREVHNNIIVSQNSRSLGDFTNDAWIVKQLELALLRDLEVSGDNYSVDSIGGTVYLIGIARNDTERQRVIDRARDIAYVKKVVSYVRLMSDPLVPEPTNRQELVKTALPTP